MASGDRCGESCSERGAWQEQGQGSPGEKGQSGGRGQSAAGCGVFGREAWGQCVARSLTP